MEQSIQDLLALTTKITKNGRIRVDDYSSRNKLQLPETQILDKDALLTALVDFSKYAYSNYRPIIYGTGDPPDPTNLEEGTIYFKVQE